MSLASKIGALFGASSVSIDSAIGGLPAGVVAPFAGATAPTGWLLCYGQAVSRTTYAALFAAIGTIYGTGDGTTTFNLPDLRGRVAAGKDNMGGSAANRLTTAGAGIDGTTIGSAGGAQTNTLTTSHMPAHNHGVSDPGHGHGASQDAHAHNVPNVGFVRSAAGYGLTQTSPGYSERVPLFPNSTTTAGAGSDAANANAVYISGNTTGITTSNNGSGLAHTITQPTVVMNSIIKT